MKTILITLGRFLIFASKNLFRLTILISYVLFKALGWLMRLLEQASENLLFYIGVFKETESESAPTFESKFTENQIDTMAKKVDETMTIKEIEDTLKISYRQARKVKEALSSTVSIKAYQSV